MKIAFVKDRMATGRGADHAVAALMNALAARGHDVVFVTTQDENVPFSVVLDQRIDIARAVPENVASAANESDVIVSAGTNEILLLKGVDRPIVQQFHTHPQSPFKWRHPLRNRAIKCALSKVDAVQVLLPGHVAALPSALRERAVVIGNAPTVLPEDGAAVKFEETVIYPAALGKSKNQELLIRAFALVARDFPGWSLEIYGTGKAAEQRRLLRSVGKLAKRTPSLQERICFMGYCNLHDAYSRCGFLAFPSRAEGFGLAIAEAAAFGKPAIGLAEAPGVNELIADGRTGILTDSVPAAFAEGMRRLMSDGSLLRRLGRDAERTVRSRYTRTAIVDSWEKLLCRVCRRQ